MALVADVTCYTALIEPRCKHDVVDLSDSTAVGIKSNLQQKEKNPFQNFNKRNSVCIN